MRSALVVSVFWSSVSTALVAQGDAGQRWRPADHPDRGLPDPAAVWTPYDPDPRHPLNRVFRTLWLATAIPAEVGAALPREHGDAAEFFAAGWYFGKRKGSGGDARRFGGDGRQLPRESFTDDERAALIEDLASIDGEVAAALRARPRLAVWFQSDLLRTARRLQDTEANPELLAPLLAAARRIALPAAVLRGEGLATFALADLAAVAPGFVGDRLVELDRRSTRLFDARFSGMWSSVYVAWPQDAADDLARWMAAATGSPKALPPVPVGLGAVLVQGLVAMDDAGVARATDVVVDVRLQTLANREPLGAANGTTTRDGVDFRVFWLERQALRECLDRASPVDLRAFRAWHDDDQVLFRDYGTSKHTTIAAQCALCHRRTHTPDEPLAGFLVLRPSATPRPVAAADARRRLAEQEFGRFLDDLRAAAK
ncbi:MAG: hypothetical protein AB7O97_02580 [Planctomycetota bacterium]